MSSQQLIFQGKMRDSEKKNLKHIGKNIALKVYRENQSHLIETVMLPSEFVYGVEVLLPKLLCNYNYLLN